MMEDKRKEELQRKIDNINGLLNILNFCKEQMKETADFLETLDGFCCHNIQIKGTDNEGNYKNSISIPLSCAEADEVVEFIKEKLKSQIRERDDEIKAESETLDRLLK